MNALRRLAAVFALALLPGCAATPAPPPASPAAEDPARQILVSFTDRALARPPVGSPGGYLRRGAEYGTTTWSHGIGAQIARRHRLRTVVEWPIMTLGVHCVVYVVDDERPLAEVIAELLEDEHVESAQAMGTFHVLAEDPYQRLQRAITGMNIEQAHRWSTGRGVSIAIVDTGVDIHHPDLAGQIARHSDLALPAGGQAFDNDIHGTAVAGVIAALAGNGQGIVGVAPQARLYAYRACWPLREGETRAVCNSLSLATALDAAIRARPRIINLSLTGPADPLVEALLAEAIARRILVVIAEPPAGSGSAGFAAGMEPVIRVRAAGQAPTASAAAEARVITAPGVDILTTFPHGTYNFITGSSFAAANVTGVIALLLQARPELALADVRYALDAAMIRDPASGGVDGLDACAALSHLDAAARCTP